MSQILPCNKFRTIFDDEFSKTHKNGDVGGWNFLQSLCNNNFTDLNRAKTECPNEIYVHPLAKRSSSRLNEKSLEMCTESLGSETGSDNGDDILLLAPEVTTTSVSASLKPREDSCYRKKGISNRRDGFPPPISSINGGNSCEGVVRVNSFRENGKLILQAVRVSSPVSCFRTERSEGRLRLCFSSDSYLSNENGVHTEQFGEEEEDEERFEEDEIEGKNGFVERKNRAEELGILYERCNEGGNDKKELVNWEQFWVST